MPRLPIALESRLLRLVLGLPEWLQRLLVRRPLVVDGQRLAPELQVMFALQRLARLPDAATLPLEEGREELRRQAVLAGGRQHVGALRDLEVDGATGPLRARLYVPTERLGHEPAPTLLFVHGGGWMYGDIESHDAACRFLAERSGVQLLSIEYRLAPEHPFPAAVEDTRAAYRWLLAHTEEVNADPARLAVGGDSAGGNLSAGLAAYAAEQGLPLAHQLLIYPGTDFVEQAPSRALFQDRGLVLTRAFIDGATAAYLTEEQKALPDASPLRRTPLPAGLAPATVVTAGLDPLRDEGEAYAELLKEHGVAVDAVRYPSMVHGFLQLVGAGREGPASVADVADRLRRALPRPA